jgi:hypothetical protein
MRDDETVPMDAEVSVSQVQRKKLQMLGDRKRLCLIQKLYGMNQETTELRNYFKILWKYDYPKGSLNDEEPELKKSVFIMLLQFRLNPCVITEDVWHRIHIGENSYQFNDWPFTGVQRICWLQGAR